MQTEMTREGGFTLLEILIALTIFAVGLLGVAGMQITAMKESSTAYTHTAAGSVAQSLMEEILARSPDDPFFVTGSATDWDFDPDAGGVNPKHLAGMGTYAARYTITRDNPVTDLARVVIVVTGQGKTVTLTGFKRVL